MLVARKKQVKVKLARDPARKVFSAAGQHRARVQILFKAAVIDTHAYGLKKQIGNTLHRQIEQQARVRMKDAGKDVQSDFAAVLRCTAGFHSCCAPHNQSRNDNRDGKLKDPALRALGIGLFNAFVHVLRLLKPAVCARRG